MDFLTHYDSYFNVNYILWCVSRYLRYFSITKVLEKELCFFLTFVTLVNLEYSELIVLFKKGHC